ncbi:hypothetical protein MBAV_003549, partial [Candidatus Magnetobacterium bavaricum]|uniref:Uncharacterized protein n=1 Tax=Candidatus Magnetobacterium bavaricum TaxID=29290 RepID=A0A0F3GHS8_9BACT
MPILNAINNMRIPKDIMKIVPFAIGGPVFPSPFNISRTTDSTSQEMMMLNLKLGDTVIRTTTDKANKGVLQQLMKEIEQQRRSGYQ